MSKGRTWRSNIAGPTIKSSGCRAGCRTGSSPGRSNRRDSAPAAFAAKAATTTIPIVFVGRRRPDPPRSCSQPRSARRQPHGH